MLRPLHDLVVILPDPQPEKIGSIHIPVLPPRDKFAENTQQLRQGTVTAVGPGMMMKRNGCPARFVKTEVKVGDVVVWDEWQGMECDVKEEGNHVIMHECNLAGAVE